MPIHRLDQPLVLLIAEDAETTAHVSKLLADNGIHTQICGSDEAARAAIRQQAPDLIICDLSLAGRNGVELVDELALEARLDGVPRMFLSATQLPDIVRRAHDDRGCYYLRKPLDAKVLIELVNRALWMPHLLRSHLGRHAQPAPRRAERIFN